MVLDMSLCSLFCLMLFVLHVEETVGKWLRALAYLCQCHHPVLFPVRNCVSSQLSNCILVSTLLLIMPCYVVFELNYCLPSELVHFVSFNLSPASTSFSILVPKEKILASPGHTLTLPCSFTPALRLEEVRWYRSDKYATPILLYKNLQIDEEVAADPHYSGRASLIGRLEEGNVSLKLENITMADTGEYVCYLQHGSWYEKGNVHVEVRGKKT